MAEPVLQMGTTFRGWMAFDKNALRDGLRLESFQPKKWEETDIDVRVTHCGVCASDLHTLRSGWGPTEFPCCAGHEVVGEVIRAGNAVERNLDVGDRIGIGPVVYVCGKSTCRECSQNTPNYCPQRVPAYNGFLPDGSQTYGGFANYCRVSSAAAIRIPPTLSSTFAAPMLCAGITTFAPLVEHGQGGKRVGVIGIGGLGHFAILFAKALKSEHIVAISRRENKRNDALELGADAYVATEEELGWMEHYASSLDVIICTVSSADMPLNKYLTLLRTGGHFCQVGMPEAPMPGLEIFGLVERKISIHFNDIGSIQETEKLLEFAARENIHPWIEERKMSDVNDVLKDMEAGKARYRYVLVSEK
ncbi:chaperonin 10-like protein [Amylocarpus encephaloides]|uniref:alcohol dehydrogenase (NADP(+)) n=1 Tax=Amylocarpus encephaloides TaxID=45428 RepID=A0A9P8C3B6_9HELO|nr:chaperonin 10-like protein [Amylocarpus encephaloides]